MASWGTKRKSLYFSVFSIVALAILALIFFGFFYKKPTCFDGKQNGTESGIDCGGACRAVCDAEASLPKVLWARSFEVAPGMYNLAAYIENPNINSTAKNVPYIFRLFDENNILVYERKGKTDILPRESFVVFETNVNTGNRKARFIFFEFEENPDWQVSAGGSRAANLKVKSQKFFEDLTPAKFEAVIENTSFESINSVEVVAVLYNTDGNVVAVSRTILDEIEKEGETKATFTWTSLPERPSRFEVILRVL
jgi:hypothetical protein